jgi:hypothetical protein
MEGKSGQRQSMQQALLGRSSYFALQGRLSGLEWVWSCAGDSGNDVEDEDIEV